MSYEPLNPLAQKCLAALKRCLVLPRTLGWKTIRFVNPRAPETSDVVYSGEGESLDYLGACRFAGWRREILPEPAALCHLTRTVEDWRQRNATVLLETNRLLAPFLPPGGHLSYPWIRQILPLDDPQWRQRAGRNLAKYRAATSQGGYDLRLTRAASEVEQFYHHMYLPYLNFRFAGLCKPRSEKEFNLWRRHGFLLDIRQDNRSVGGVMCWRQGARLGVGGLAVAEDFGTHLKAGVLGVAYYHLVAVLAPQMGVAAVDMLRSRAATDDGVYRHKKTWGALPRIDPWPHVLWSIHPPLDGRLPDELATQLCREDGGLGKLGAATHVARFGKGGRRR